MNHFLLLLSLKCSPRPLNSNPYIVSNDGISKNKVLPWMINNKGIIMEKFPPVPGQQLSEWRPPLLECDDCPSTTGKCAKLNTNANAFTQDIIDMLKNKVFISAVPNDYTNFSKGWKFA
jgi:hypothetical protein